MSRSLGGCHDNLAGFSNAGDQKGKSAATVPTRHLQSTLPPNGIGLGDIDMPHVSLQFGPSPPDTFLSSVFVSSETSPQTPGSSSPRDTLSPNTPTTGTIPLSTPPTDSTPCDTTSSSPATYCRLSVDPELPFLFVPYTHGAPPRKRLAAGTARKPGPRPKQTKPRPRQSFARVDVLQTDTAPQTTTKKDASGQTAGTIIVYGHNQVVRCFPTRKQERATNHTRSVGACERCRQARQRCVRPETPGSVYQPCARCVNFIANSYMKHVNSIQYKYPCIRADLLDLCLHRKGPTIRNDLQTWFQEKKKLLLEAHEENSSRILFVTQGFGEGFEDALWFKVSLFQKKPGDRTAYFWTDASGQPRSMEMPPYFISDPEAACKSLVDFTKRVRSVYIETITADSNPIIRKTFQAALVFVAFNSEAQLVSDALDIWVAARLIEKQFRVFNGGPTAGMEHVDEAGHPFDGFIPMTPMMDSQLDDMVIRGLIRPFCDRFLAKLKHKIEQRKRENWMEIYLAMFIMMSNMGLILKDMAIQANWKGLKPGNRGGTLTQGFMHACKTMLAYFHYACAGSIPVSSIFAESQHSTNKSYHGMEPDQIEYLRSMRQEILRQDQKLSKWNEMSMYDDELYWCYQLLVEDWRGDIPYVAGDIDDFREEDFLSSSTT